MKQGEIQYLLTSTNRWWRNPRGWTADDPDVLEAAEAPFDYRPKVLGALTPGGLYLLRGPRRVGKSVAVKRAIEGLIDNGTEPRRILHVSVDGWRAGNLGLLVDAAKQLLPADGARYWFIDEITSITDGWPERIKWLRDNDARFRRDTVVLTGSSATNLTASVKALADRRGQASDPDRVLLPMGFRTFTGLVIEDPVPDDIGRLRLRDLTPKRLRVETTRLAPWLDQLVSAWEAYLQVGGFPRAVASYLTERAPDLALQRGLLDVIHGDAFADAHWARPQTMALLTRLAEGLGSPANRAAIAGDIGTSSSTVGRRLDDLREAFVVWPAYREEHLRPKLRAQEKLYFTDPIYTQLVPHGPLDLTRLSEQQLGVALLRGLELEEPGSYVDFSRILHHRTPARKEIDFVGPDLGGVAIESKYVDGRWRGQAQTLRASPWRGIVATRTELDVTDPEVVAVPTALLAWLVDTG
ncbi:MAG TPA: AAA family ATPase [Nitriliruptorales bacterium]